MKTLHISAGNSKMGAIPSFSLPAGMTCAGGAGAPCFKDCYARRLQTARPNVLKAYCENLTLVESDPEWCRSFLNWWLDNPNAPRMFRIHVSGDFFSRDYWLLWLDVIRKHPDTRFMAFTKQFGVVRTEAGSLPENLTLIASAWPGVALPDWVQGTLPIAYMQDGTETRVPKDAHRCDGNCAGECRGHCWKMKAGDSVVLEKH
jgi:hypothetical protein